jgi:hypothetical protein
MKFQLGDRDGAYFINAEYEWDGEEDEDTTSPKSVFARAALVAGGILMIGLLAITVVYSAAAITALAAALLVISPFLIIYSKFAKRGKKAETQTAQDDKGVVGADERSEEAKSEKN